MVMCPRSATAIRKRSKIKFLVVLIWTSVLPYLRFLDAYRRKSFLNQLELNMEQQSKDVTFMQQIPE